MLEVEGVPLQLPEFITELRPHQEQAIKEVTAKFRDRKVVILDAPTGAGKTIIGEAQRQILRSQRHGRFDRGLYVCTTKSLQEQFLHDFPRAKLIKGRANYPTYDDPELFEHHGARHVDASHCTKSGYSGGDLPICSECEFSPCDAKLFNIEDHDLTDEQILHCHYCHPWQACPYEVAKNEAIVGPLTVANTAYFLTEANYVGRFGRHPKYGPTFPFIIVDEADTLESVLMGFVELSFSRRYIKEYGIGLPTHVTKPSSWLEWATQAKERVKQLANDVDAEIRDHRQLREVTPKRIKSKADQYSRHLGTLQYVERSLQLEPDNWVLDGYKDGNVVLKPVTVGPHARSLLWDHADKFLLMSATTISPHQVADDLGLTSEEWDFVQVDSNFPVESRPIYVRSRANMTNKTKDTEWPKMAKAVADVLDLHPQERVLIHTVSYAWTRHLENALRSTPHRHRILTYSDSRERESVLETYKNRPNGVLLAPSFDRGIDLPDDLCRAIVITKVPFPNLGDKQVNKRFFGTGQSGKNWYYTQTIRSIVQMTGRGMRHKGDYVTSYILDAQFQSNLFATPVSRNRLPRWWAEALQWDAPKRR